MSAPSPSPIPPDPNTLPNISQCLNEKPLDAFLCIQKEAADNSYLRNYSYCESGSLPVPLSNEPICPLGFYCPNINLEDESTWPQYCPPTTECAILRLGNQWCTAQGKYEPTLCTPGYYCPTFATQYICPEDHFCVRGTNIPVECSPLSYCPEGTRIGIFYGGALFSLLIDMVLIGIFIWYYYYMEPLQTKLKNQQRRKAMLFHGTQLLKLELPISQEEVSPLQSEEIRTNAASITNVSQSQSSEIVTDILSNESLTTSTTIASKLSFSPITTNNNKPSNDIITLPNPYHNITHSERPTEPSSTPLHLEIPQITIESSTSLSSPSTILSSSSNISSTHIQYPPSSSYTSPTTLPSKTRQFIPLLSNTLWNIMEAIPSSFKYVTSLFRMKSSLPPGIIIEDMGNGKSRRLRTNSMRRSSTVSSPFDTPTPDHDDYEYLYDNKDIPSNSNSNIPISSPPPSARRKDRISRMSNLASSSSFRLSSTTSPVLTKASQLIRRPSIYLRDSLIQSVQSSSPEDTVDSKQLLSSWFQSRHTNTSISSPFSSLNKFRLFSITPTTEAISSQSLSNGNRQTITAASSVLEHVFRVCNTNLRLHLTFENLGLTLPAPINKTILSSVSGSIVPGKVTAIMGPSGAGKTTFLSVLLGTARRSHGTLLINKEPQEMEYYRNLIGFVPQDDTMLTELTVRENIEYSARIRLPRNNLEWTKAFGTTILPIKNQRTSSSFGLLWNKMVNVFTHQYSSLLTFDTAVQIYVDAIIEVLGLTTCADTLVGSVSGGQRKRTNIGIELAAAPCAIFLDEPTSGLDATAALEVCATLRVIANLGLTVVAVIHQPRAEIFASFDDLLLLAPGGMTVFTGPQKKVMDYFYDCGLTPTPNANPADTILDFIAGRYQLRIPLEEIYRLRLYSIQTEIEKERDLSNTGLIEGTAVSKWLNSRWKIYQQKQQETNGINTTSESSVLQNDFAVPTPKKSIYQVMNKYMQQSYTYIKQKSVALISPSSTSPSIPIGGRSRGASFVMQYILALQRSLLQQYRRPTWLVLELLVIGVAAATMGLAATAVDELYSGVLKPPYTVISPAPLETMLPSLGLYINMAIGIAGAPVAVRLLEMEIAQRESRAGHNIISYYLAKQTSSLPRLFLAAFHFASIFCLLARPTANFYYLFFMSLGIFLGVYGLAIVVSLFVDRANAALVGVIFSLVMSVLCGFGPSITQFSEWNIGFIHTIAYSRWANELWIHSETLLYRDNFLVEEITAAAFGYTLNRPNEDIVNMLIISICLRILAGIILYIKLKK